MVFLGENLFVIGYICNGISVELKSVFGLFGNCVVGSVYIIRFGIGIRYGIDNCIGCFKDRLKGSVF